MATKQTQEKLHKHHYIRTPIATLFGTLALLFIVLSVLMFWANRTLTNTDAFVSTISPTIQDPDVQQFIATEATNSFIEEAPIEDLSKELLDNKQIDGKSLEQQQQLVEQKIENALTDVLASQEFQTAWKDSSQDIHSQIITQLDSDSGQLEIDLKPVLDNTVKQLEGTDLDEFASEIKPKPGEAVVKIDGSEIENVHKAYQGLKNGFYALSLIAIVFAGIAVLVSVHHMKTLRRISIATGILLAIIYAVTKLPTYITINADNPATESFVKALSQQLLGGLQSMLLVLIIIFIGLPIISKIIEIVSAKKSQ